ncbi:MAG: hypothetical protein ACREQ9_16725, partial [Candidatus Binatia bacterium]
TSEDVLDAQALLAEQRTIRATALYQAHTRRAELRQVMGVDLLDPDEVASPAPPRPEPVPAVADDARAPVEGRPEWQCEPTAAGVRCARIEAVTAPERER